MSTSKEKVTIQGIVFTISEVKKMGKKMFCKAIEETAKRKRANAEDWYSQITGSKTSE